MNTSQAQILWVGLGIAGLNLILNAAEIKNVIFKTPAPTSSSANQPVSTLPGPTGAAFGALQTPPGATATNALQPGELLGALKLPPGATK